MGWLKFWACGPRKEEIVKVEEVPEEVMHEETIEDICPAMVDPIDTFYISFDKGKNGAWRWTLRDGSDRFMCNSGALGFPTKELCRKHYDKVRAAVWKVKEA